jgi:uncharacterized protein YjbJ (UPF0337 family)
VKFKAGLLVGLGAGYVLGTRAGRERYQQIAEAARAFMDNPGVQRLSGEVNKTVAVGKDRVADAAKGKVEQASTGLQEQAGKAKEFVTSKVGAKKDDTDLAGTTSRPEPGMTPAGTVPSTTGPATDKLP